MSPGGDGTRLPARAVWLAIAGWARIRGVHHRLRLHERRLRRRPDLGDYTASIAVTAAVIGTLVARRGWKATGLGRNRWTRLAALSGVLSGVSGILLILGLHLGDLAVIGVLNSLYPLSTLVLAMIFLGERLSVWQWVGVVVGLGGAAVLAA